MQEFKENEQLSIDMHCSQVRVHSTHQLLLMVA